MSITAEKFQEFAELALTAFNSQKVENASLKDEIVVVRQQLAEALLANEAADAETIRIAKESEAVAEENLRTLSTKSEADNQALLDAIAKLESDLGLTIPVAA